MREILIDVRKRTVTRLAMQLCLNFNKRMVYDNTEQPVREGDVVHVKNKPYFISEVLVDDGVVWVTSMDEHHWNRPFTAEQIRAHVN